MATAFSDWGIPFQQKSDNQLPGVVADLRFTGRDYDHLDDRSAATGADLLNIAPNTMPALEQGGRLDRGQSVVSPNGRYALTFQWDGDLVETAAGMVVWESGTGSGSAPPSYAYLGLDGRLVVEGQTGGERWSTPEAESANGAFSLGVDDNGQITIRAGDGTLVWSGPYQSQYVGDRLLVGQVLSKGQSLMSQDGRFTLDFQQDGNLVVHAWTTLRYGQAIWSSGTQGQDVDSAYLQPDGSFVIKDADGSTAWSSGSKNPLWGDYSMVMQNNGNLVAYTGLRSFPGFAIRYWSTDSKIANSFLNDAPAVPPSLDWTLKRTIKDRVSGSGVQLAANDSTILSAWNGLGGIGVYFSTSANGVDWSSAQLLSGLVPVHGSVGVTTFTGSFGASDYLMAWVESPGGQPFLAASWSANGTTWSNVKGLGSFDTASGVQAVGVGSNVYLFWVNATTSQIWYGKLNPTNMTWILSPTATPYFAYGRLPGAAYVPGQGVVLSFLGLSNGQGQSSALAVNTAILDPDNGQWTADRGSGELQVSKDAFGPVLVVLDGVLYMGVVSQADSSILLDRDKVGGFTWYVWNDDPLSTAPAWSTTGPNVLDSDDRRVLAPRPSRVGSTWSMAGSGSLTPRRCL